jgi:hypothetical protein
MQVAKVVRAALGRVASLAREQAIVKTLVGTPSKAVYADTPKSRLIVLAYPAIRGWSRLLRLMGMIRA